MLAMVSDLLLLWFLCPKVGCVFVSVMVDAPLVGGSSNDGLFSGVLHSSCEGCMTGVMFAWDCDSL